MARDDGEKARALDPEIRAFVVASELDYPADAAGRPVAEQRRFYKAMCDRFRAPRPAGVTTGDSVAPGPAGPIPFRRYRPAGALRSARIVYFHGGGFFLGDLESHDDVCAELAAGSGFELVSVDYRLAPEASFSRPVPGRPGGDRESWRGRHADHPGGRQRRRRPGGGRVLGAAAQPRRADPGLGADLPVAGGGALGPAGLSGRTPRRRCSPRPTRRRRRRPMRASPIRRRWPAIPASRRFRQRMSTGSRQVMWRRSSSIRCATTAAPGRAS